MEGKNPCDVCKRKHFASKCDGCVLEESNSNCENYDCFCNKKGSCLLSLGAVCKASTNYEDDYKNHFCDECSYYRELECGKTVVFYCEKIDNEVSGHDCACDHFDEMEVE